MMMSPDFIDLQVQYSLASFRELARLALVCRAAASAVARVMPALKRKELARRARVAFSKQLLAEASGWFWVGGDESPVRFVRRVAVAHNGRIMVREYGYVQGQRKPLFKHIMCVTVSEEGGRAVCFSLGEVEEYPTFVFGNARSLILILRMHQGLLSRWHAAFPIDSPHYFNTTRLLHLELYK
jgi:hypothetical protein